MRKQPLLSITVQPPAPAPEPVLDEELTDRELLAIDESAHREALFNAWFATGLEQTKSIFTLASAGVGLCLTLIFGMNPKPDDAMAPVWLLLAGVAFGISAGSCIWVMRANSALVRRLLKKVDASSENGLVLRLDLFSRILFGAGMVLLLFASVATIWVDKAPQHQSSSTNSK